MTQLLLDFGSRTYLALRLAGAGRPALVDEATWGAILATELCAIDVRVMAVLVDLVGEPALIPALRRASQMYAAALSPPEVLAR
ncbi:MAG: hypothetical protein MUO25_03295 [Thermoanaerobaculaceae bacterium]|nr:hypothetical protein [Thermoanaerobaculaceae bacterium]